MSSLPRDVRAGVPDVPRKTLSARLPAGKRISNTLDSREMTPEQLASVIFDQACIRAGFKGGYIAETLKVGEPLVSKWRDPDYTQLPTIGQVFALGPEFLRCFKKEQEKYYGWPKAALVELVEAFGSLAEEMSA